MSELFIEIVEKLQESLCKEYSECEVIVWDFLNELDKEDVSMFMSSNISDKIEMIKSLYRKRVIIDEKR